METYTGLLGPTKAFVDTMQPYTGQIQWNDNLPTIFAGHGQDPGNVSGYRWCTGTLIDDSHFLTAGHCYRPDVNGFHTPVGYSTSGGLHKLSANELAPLTHINFNYQINGQTNQIRAAIVYPVLKMTEYTLGNFDYAILELGPDNQQVLPGKRFGHIQTDASATELAKATLLTVIQHPDGLPKKISAGSKIALSAEAISYSDVDTLGGSSGAGVIDQNGKLIGVHTIGGCLSNGTGANSGVALAAIKKVSTIIQ